MILQIVILVLGGIHVVFGVFGIPLYRMRNGAGLFESTLLCWGLEIIWAVTCELAESQPLLVPRRERS